MMAPVTGAAPDLSSVIGSSLSQFNTTALQARGLPPFTELVRQAVGGELDLSLSGILQKAAELFFAELSANNTLIRQLLIVAVLSAVLSCLTDAFKHKSAGELGFYVSYILMVLLAASSFHLAAGILSEVVGTLAQMTEASVPLIVSLMAASGDIASAAVFHPALMFATGLITRFIEQIFIPLVLASAAVSIVNYLAEEAPLTKLALLLKKAAGWTLKGVAGLYMLLLTLQKFSVPLLNNFAVSTAQTATKAIPVVGGALSSAVDTVVSASTAARSGVLVAFVVIACVAAAVPLFKMLAILITYKVLAALTQPICDKRFTDCVDHVGTYMGLLLGAGALVSATFICAAAVLLLR